jgi:AraC-like DNA-binding protein
MDISNINEEDIDNTADDHWLMRISPVPRIVGQAVAPPGWVEPERALYDHELVIFLHGSGRVDINSEVIHCRAPYFVIIPPAVPHSSHAAANERWHRRWIHFDWEYSPGQEKTPVWTYLPQMPEKELLRLPPIYLPRRIFHGEIHRPAEAADLFARFQNCWGGGPAAEHPRSRVVLLELLLLLFSSDDDSGGNENQKNAVAFEVKNRIDAYMQQSPEKVINIQHLLSGCGYSYAHAERAFHRAFSLTPATYIRTLRVTRAAILLRETNLSVSEISRQVGIADPLYFSRVFTRHTGMPPTSYRREIKLKIEN